MAGGSWWLAPVFAHYAGVIDHATIHGGICYDKNGAYAIVLRDAGVVNGLSGEAFTYRCTREDKGRYRLTAANQRSRIPVRVFRCQTLNSALGPKAGIRFDGL